MAEIKTLDSVAEFMALYESETITLSKAAMTSFLESFVRIGYNEGIMAQRKAVLDALK